MLAILNHFSLTWTILDRSNRGNQATCGLFFKVVRIRLLLGQRCDPIATLCVRRTPALPAQIQIELGDDCCRRHSCRIVVLCAI